MPITIEDGRGSGYVSGVTAEKRLMSSSRTIDLLDYGAINSSSYTIDSGIITLTSGNESAIMYIKNINPNFLMQASTLTATLGNSNSHGDVIIRVYANPTGGTIISDGYEINSNNRNLGSTIPAIMTSFVGSEGKTVTGGISFANFIFQDTRGDTVNSGIVLPNGASLALSIQPPAGNTSMKVTMFVRVVFFDPGAI